jgi:zinc D-Ala-D-Ala carboxypeptidase
MRLSQNFTLDELTKSSTALRHGIENIPRQIDVESLAALVENVLQPVRDHHGPVIVSSGYRCPELNTKIGSKNTSQHVRGQAADFEIMGRDNSEVAKWIYDNLDFDQLILEFYEAGQPRSGWVHCSYVGSEFNRNMALIINSKGVRPFPN